MRHVGLPSLPQRYSFILATKFQVSHVIIFDNLLIYYLLISADVYAWLVVFVLPLNSAVNPLLYTFTTPKYRNQVLLRGWNKFASRKEVNKGDGSGTSNQGTWK